MRRDNTSKDVNQKINTDSSWTARRNARKHGNVIINNRYCA